MTDRSTIRLVVLFLGCAAIAFGSATAILVGLVVWLSRGSGSVDASAVALIGVVAQPASAALAGLGALLVSTRSAPDKGEIEEVLAPLEAAHAAGQAESDAEHAKKPPSRG